LLGKLKLSFEDRGEQHLKNIARAVRVYALQGAAPRLSLPDKPSIAVLPFTNMSGDSNQDYFCDGMVEEIIAALSRFRSLFVVAHNSTFTYKGRAVDVRQVSRELGVQYVLQGSIRKAGNRIRIIAQLIDAVSGGHIWSERYDGELTEIFDLQDRVTEAIVGAIEPTITLAEIERAKRKRPDSLDAYNCVMRALPAVWSQDPQTMSEGLRQAQRAMVLDPTYALPKALAAYCYAQRVTYMRASDPAADRAKALQLARDGASLDSNDPLVLTVLSAAYNLVGQVDLGLAAIEKALTVDPNSAWAWLRSGWSNTYAGRHDTAIDHFRRAMRLSPLDPMRFSALVGIGAAHFAKGQCEEAAQWIEKGLCERPDAVWCYRLLTAAYAEAGQLEQAKRAAARFLDAYPDMTVSKAIDATPPSSPLRKRIAEGLRRAGLRE
jgi:adenylate cyclase